MNAAGYRAAGRIAAVILMAFMSVAAARATAAEASLAGFDLRMLTGARPDYPAPHGVVTVLVLWSPDSLGSRKSISELERFHAARGERVRIVAAATQGDETRIRAFMHDHGLHFPVGLLQQAASRVPADEQLPVLYFIDEAGEVRATRAGLFRFRTLERGVEALLGTAGER